MTFVVFVTSVLGGSLVDVLVVEVITTIINIIQNAMRPIKNLKLYLRF